MQRKFPSARWVFVCGALTLMTSGQSDSADKTTDKSAPDKPPSYTVSSAMLGGAERMLTMISTDKPIYRVGETVYVRIVALNARNHTPLAADSGATVEVRGPKGDIVAAGQTYSQGGVFGFAWPVKDGLAGGEYTFGVTFMSGLPPAERKIDLRIFRAPRLKSQIEFRRDGFGPGDTVTATLHTERAEGGIPKGAKVSVSARVDDREVYSGKTTVDAQGNATTSFALPTEIERGEGSLAMAIEDGGVVETASKTIPILVASVDIQMFPEGGDLVAGMPNRLYVEARTPAKKPADIEASVIDASGRALARFKTEHEGRGRVAFTPVAGESYALKIIAPAGIKRTFPLPATKAKGAVLQAATDVIGKADAASFKVAASDPGRYTLSLRQHETEVAQKTVTIGSGGWFSSGGKPGELNEVTLPLPAALDGVLIATLWDAQGTPLCERLVFRQPQKALKVSVSADRQSYVPGGKVKLEVATSDDSGAPVGALVGVTVTDESVLELVEKREQAPRLPVMYYLEPEVRELADAHVYLDAQNPKGPLATDLLLATQGWRRFALKDVAAFINQYGDQARRALAIHVFTPPPVTVTPSPVDMMPAPAMAAAPPPVAFSPPPRPSPRAAPPKAPKGAAMPDAQAEARPGARPAAPVAAPAPAAPPPPPPAMPPAGIAQPMPPRAQGPAMAMEKAKEAPEAKEMQKAAMGARARHRQERMIVAGDEEAPARPNEMAYVREYAHPVRANRQADDRIDFTETLYWTAAVQTDQKTGKATVSFDMSDAVTAFRVAADGVSKAGALGLGTSSVKSVKPFYLEAKMPLQVTGGDSVDLPVALVNATSSPLSVSLSSSGPKGLSVPGESLTLAGDTRERRLLRIPTAKLSGKVELSLEAKAGNYSDKVTRTLDVRPQGFPIDISKGGMLMPNAGETVELTLPQSVVQGSIATEVAVYPTPLGNLTQALSRLMQEPNGCFEQTSSTSYPLTMAQQYFTTHQGVDPAVVKQSGEILTRGYQRLTSFECKDKGYEWFGGASPGHEALTAYGLMQFGDMRKAKLTLVDDRMLERTRAWLLSRRDGKGGFSRNQRALDSFGGAPADTTNAYITWAMLEAGEKGLEPEITAVKKAGLQGGDSYVMALAANVAALANDSATAGNLLDKLAAKQEKDGSVSGAKTTITQSGGEALQVETTSIATLGWLKAPKYAGNVEKGVKFLTSVCEGGRFSSTQATVLALKTIVAYDQSRAKPKAPGSLQLLVDGRPVGAPVSFSAATEGALTLPNLEPVLTAGKHNVTVQMSGGSQMPYSVSLRYNALTPVSAEATKLSLETTLQDSQVQEGKLTEIRVNVSNSSTDDVPTPVAIIGLPGGLEVRHDQLKELQKAGTIAAYEVLGREVVLYWRNLKAKQSVSLPISLVAAIPGRYMAPASRVYPYYTDEQKRWVPGTRVEVTPLAGVTP